VHHLAKRSGREYDDLMTAHLEGTADANERMDISSRSDRGQDEAPQDDTGRDFLIRPR
jgi:hypothetical protein